MPISRSSVSSVAPRSEGPSLRRSYPTSTVLRPSPPPDTAAGRTGVGGATLHLHRVSHVAQKSFPACCPHYPDGTPWVRVLVSSPGHSGLPHSGGGSASVTILSGPAQGSRSLRPAGLHAHQKWTDFPEASTGAVASTHRSGSYRDKPEIARTELSSAGSLRLRGALPNVGVGSSAAGSDDP